RERHEVFDADGWYRTGDFVVVDADGFFHFQGRRGDVIKTSGANVSPRQVEAAAVRVPAGRDVGVDVGVYVDELRERLGERLSAYKVPRRFLLLADEAVPLLSSGKLDRRALEALFDAA